MIATKDIKMAELIHHDYEVISVLRKFNIKFGFGDKPVEEVCAEQDINTNFFLEIVNSFFDENYFPQSKLQEQNVEDILFYLRNTHQLYLNKKVPAISSLIEQLQFDKDHQKNKMLLENFFNEYKQEFISHIEREDERIYPYISQLAEALRNCKASKVFLERTQQYSIVDYLDEHDDVEEKLYDLKNIIIKYLPTPENTDVYTSILVKLFKLEKDLNEHSRMEEKVIVPKVIEMEKAFAKAVKDSKIELV
jgi:regulator of cell morphogenesis and NO signaling